MIPESLQTRSVTFAFLFGPPRFVTREEASSVYGHVCDTLKLDDFTFRYDPSDPGAQPASKGFAIRLHRKEGRGQFGLLVENPSIQKPIRLLLEWNWPPAVKVVTEQFDLTADAVFDQLRATTPDGAWQKVHAEVRLRANCQIAGQSALGFMLDRFLRLPSDWIRSLGEPLAFGALKFEVASAQAKQSSLDAPKRELSIEVLREDAKGLYFELVSTWRQVPTQSGPGAVIDVASLRPIDRQPSEYMTDAHDYLSERLQGLANLGN